MREIVRRIALHPLMDELFQTRQPGIRLDSSTKIIY
jgi:hypothetical protein